MEYRIEKDTMGTVQVPSDKLWGAQTQRSYENFKIGGQQMPLEVVHALAYVKKAAAYANCELGVPLLVEFHQYVTGTGAKED